MFKIGQKIICVKPTTGYDAGGWKSISPQIKVGEIFTYDGYNNVTDGIYLKEITALNRYGKRASYTAEKFRPLDETFAEETLIRIAEEIEEENLVSV